MGLFIVPNCGSVLPPLRTCSLRSQFRSFTTYRPLLGSLAFEKRRNRALKDQRRGASEKSMSLATKRGQQDPDTFPNDLGVMLGTLVMPTGVNLPGLFRDPRLRSKMELQRAWKRIKDFASVIAIKFMGKPRLKLRMFRTASIAVGLHRQMYTAVADGDRTTISQVCGEGLRERMTARISLRRQEERYEWTLHSYVGRPRVVSHRATTLPIEDEKDRKTALRQAIVKVVSKQSLRKLDGHETRANTYQGEVKQITEYVVIQRRLWKGVEEPWIIWGTVQETTMEDWDLTISPKIPKIETA